MAKKESTIVTKTYVKNLRSENKQEINAGRLKVTCKFTYFMTTLFSGSEKFNTATATKVLQFRKALVTNLHKTVSVEETQPTTEGNG